MKMPAKLRWIVRRRILKDKEKRKRVTTVPALFPIVFISSYVSFLWLETIWIAVAVIGTWLISILVVNGVVSSNRALIVDCLYAEIRDRWTAFNERIGKSPEGSWFEDIPARYETVYSRFEDIDERPPELKPLVDGVFENTVALAGEWLRQDKVYRFYERARDINSEPLLDKAKGLIATLIERTNDFADLVGRLVETLNRLEAFELETEVAHEFGIAGSTDASDLSPITGLVEELRDWSKCLTEAQEELYGEQF